MFTKCTSMSDFYPKAGRLLDTYTRESGKAPHRAFEQVFNYERGQAVLSQFGDSWEFNLSDIPLDQPVNANHPCINGGRDWRYGN